MLLSRCAYMLLPCTFGTCSQVLFSLADNGSLKFPVGVFATFYMEKSGIEPEVKSEGKACYLLCN